MCKRSFDGIPQSLNEAMSKGGLWAAGCGLSQADRTMRPTLRRSAAIKAKGTSGSTPNVTDAKVNVLVRETPALQAPLPV